MRPGVERALYEAVACGCARWCATASAFVGSQSLRRIELERRREVGIIIRQRPVASRIAAIFEDDWQLATPRAGRRTARTV